MKSRNLPVLKTLLYSLLVLLLFACQVEIAKPDPEKKLVVATNFITPKQAQLFRKWEKKSGIELRFVQLSAQQIKNQISKNPWSPGFDVVWFNGLEDFLPLQKTHFQERSLDFAQIPIGLSYVPDSVNQVKDFVKLSQTNLWAAADDYSYPLLKAHFDYAFRNRAKNKKQNTAYRDILSGLKDRKLAFNGADQYHTNMLLCRYDTYQHVLRKANRKQLVIYPKFFKYAGVSDRSIFCIVAQTPHYSSALRFKNLLRLQLQKSENFVKQIGIQAFKNRKENISGKILLGLLKK